jgi:hypothetical protein
VALATGDASLLDEFRRVTAVFDRDQASVQTGRAISLHLEGDLPEAREAYREAAERWTPFSVEERARAFLGAGRCGRDLGDPEAAEELDAGETLLRSLGAARVA